MNQRIIFYFLLMTISVQAWTQIKTNLLVPKAATVDITKNKDPRGAIVHPMELPMPDGEGEKARLALLKTEMELNYPRKSVHSNQLKTDSLVQIQAFTGFEGNIFQNGAPNG
jgi:hypothetical protein